MLLRILTNILVLGLSTADVVAASVQQPTPQVLFGNALSREELESGKDSSKSFRPVEHLSALSTTVFTTLAHPLFPSYSVRIKKSHFCDSDVNAYTGYVDIGARHLFFYFFESRSEPDIDDVIFWTNGGPGCSSSLGLFMELGPCRIEDENSTKINPHSWNSNANIFFIDQPAGVGFSYTDYGEIISTTEEAAEDIAAFVAIFFEKFSQFKGRKFHMAGESYGGRYLPIFASAIFDQNAKLIKANMTTINLRSVMIGNGLTDAISMVLSYFDMTCTAASIPQFFDISTCIRMKQAIPRCRKWLKSSCTDLFDAISCEAAMNFCSMELEMPLVLSGKNPYDISKDCEGGLADSLCYPITKTIRAYLDQLEVRENLGVDSSVGPFESCSNTVNSAFHSTLDALQPTYHWLAALLERDVRALIYVGNYDWICNWVGNEALTLALEWSGQAAFIAQPLEGWTVNGKSAGKVRSFGPLTFATITGAGHMVPYDKPVEALELVSRWLREEEI